MISKYFYQKNFFFPLLTYIQLKVYVKVYIPLKTFALKENKEMTIL